MMTNIKPNKMNRDIFRYNKNVLILFLNMFFLLFSNNHVFSQNFIAPEYILEFKVLPNYLEVFAFRNINGVPGTYYVAQDVTTSADWKLSSCYTIKNLDENKTHKFPSSKIESFSTNKSHNFKKLAILPKIDIGIAFKNKLSDRFGTNYGKDYFSIGAASILPMEPNNGKNLLEISYLAQTSIRKSNRSIQNSIESIAQTSLTYLNNGIQIMVITGSGPFQSNPNVGSMYNNNIAIARAVLGLEYTLSILNANLSPQDRFEASPALNQGKIQYSSNNEIILIGKDNDKFKCYFRNSSGSASTYKNDYAHGIWFASLNAFI